MGEGKLPPLTTSAPLNRQSPNIAHAITSTISPHTPHLVKVAPGVTSPHIAKFTTQFLPREAMHKRGLCCHAVSVRLPVTFVDHVKTNKHIFEIFSPSGSDTILVFFIPKIMWDLQTLRSRSFQISHLRQHLTSFTRHCAKADHTESTHYGGVLQLYCISISRH